MIPMKTCQCLGILILALTSPKSVQAAGAGLPQLDIATWPSQLFWLVVLFTAGYVLMARFVTPRISSILEERRTRIDEDLNRARTTSEDAARVRAEYETNLEAARNAAAETAKQAAAEAAKRAEVSDAKIAKKLSEKVAKAEVKLTTARNEAMANLNNVAAEVAVAVVAQLTDIQTTAAQAGKTADKLSKRMAEQEAI